MGEVPSFVLDATYRARPSAEQRRRAARTNVRLSRSFALPHNSPQGFFPRSPAGLTVVAGVLVDAAGFEIEEAGVGVAAGRLAFNFVITESLKS